MAFDLSTRNLQPELMDDPTLDQSSHHQALIGLRRINWWSRTDAAVWNILKKIAQQSPAGVPTTVLDIASGGGDLAIRLAKIARQENIPIQIHGCDISPTAIAHATQQTQAAGLSNVSFHQCNALEESLPRPSYDVVMCSLFLHHLNADQAHVLLGRMKTAAKKLVLVDDLRRTRFGYWLAWLGCRILTRCYIVHIDGPMSVEGAFTTAEATDIAVKAGLKNPTMQHHWPQRFLLSWRPNAGEFRA